MADKTLNTRIQLRRDTAANWTSENPTLLVGEVGIETDTLRRKVGDGSKTWSQLRYVDTVYTELTPEASTTDAAALATITGQKQGDVATVKRQISTTGKYTYTGYVYDGSNWGAMDGNYSAENVYFAEDLVYTKQIGELPDVPSTGSGTLASTGKNVKQVLSTILAAEKQPSATLPSANFKTYSGATSTTVEPGTAISGTVTYELQLNSAGSYTYGPATGVTEDGTYSITYYDGTSTGLTKDTKSGTFNYSFTVGTSNVSVGVSASSVGHTQGAIAKTNLGNDSDIRITAGSVSAGTKANTWTSSRKSFWVVDTTTGTSLDQSSTEAKATTSWTIRNLANKEFGTKTSYSLAIADGTKRVMIAVPGSHDMTKCIDVDGMGLDIQHPAAGDPAFAIHTGIKVGGIDSSASDIGSYPGDYTVFLMEKPAGVKSTTYNITLS